MAASPYSLEGARTILSGPDDAWIGTLGALLGVGVLASGPAGLAAWGWVDQKNEMVGLLGRLVTAGRDRLRGGRAPERADVLAATHTALVYGAFFAAIRETLGPVYDRIGLTEEDKRRLTDRAAAGPAQERLTATVTTTPIPLPWAGCGFHATRDTVIGPRYRELAVLCVRFFQNFAVWERAEVLSPVQPLIEDMVGRAVRRYDAEYKLLAADVREFEIWAMLGEHQATRATAGQAVESLARLEKLMASLTGAAREQAGQVRRFVAGFNRAALLEPLVAAGVSDDLPALRVPAIEEGYLSPAYRWMVMSDAAAPADESWWVKRTPLGGDLDAFLAAYFSSPRSHERPLVVLGHPGSGKSMFTKVCAARLSGSDAFSAARIPLRQVPDPSAPVYQQVAAVLGKATNGRVSWAELSDASADATRVLFIDGLDEFMQASGTAESNYLQNVVEFQRIERLASRPVAVIVTSRTLVADLARIPEGCLVIKLEDFSTEQVGAWLDIWERANPYLRHSGLAGIPSAASVLSYGDIARQPLLLLLLVLHGAANGLPPMQEDSTPAQIYGAILRRFIERELNKPGDTAPAAGDDAAIQAELWRLGIAAFGMFNRGKHYIEEQTLLDDLQILVPAPRQRQNTRRGGALSAARRVLGRFFFIHASEVDEGVEGRSYEFLHTTFGEYLIAYFVTTELAELWRARDRPSSQNWDDDRLYALLSHQTLNSGGSSVLPFIEQLHAGPDGSRRAGDILRVLLREAEDRWDRGRYGAYSPSTGTYMERYAIYTANLLLLLLHVESDPVTLASIVPPPEDSNDWWTRLVRLWQGYLDVDFLDTISPEGEPDWAITRGGSSAAQPAVHTEWLALSRIDAVVLNAGHGAVGNEYAIASSDREIEALGQAARAYVDPEAFWDGRRTVTDLIHAGETGRAHHYSRALLAAHVAHSPELFAVADVVALDPFVLEARVSPDWWPRSLLAAQYPELAGRPDTRAYLAQVPPESPGFAALLAGALIWGDRWPAGAEILARTPAVLHEVAAGLRPWIDGMAGLADERRQVLVIAGHLVVVMQRLLVEEDRAGA